MINSLKIEVDSSVIDTIERVPEGLRILFCSGKAYTYIMTGCQFEGCVGTLLRDYTSVGRWFDQEIKGEYQTTEPVKLLEFTEALDLLEQAIANIRRSQ